MRKLIFIFAFLTILCTLLIKPPLAFAKSTFSYDSSTHLASLNSSDLVCPLSGPLGYAFGYATQLNLSDFKATLIINGGGTYTFTPFTFNMVDSYSPTNFYLAYVCYDESNNTVSNVSPDNISQQYTDTYIGAGALLPFSFTASNVVYDSNAQTLNFDTNVDLSAYTGRDQPVVVYAIDGTQLTLLDSNSNPVCTSSHCTVTGVYKNGCPNDCQSDAGVTTVAIGLSDIGNGKGTSSQNLSYSLFSAFPPSVAVPTASVNPVQINTPTTLSATFTDASSSVYHTATWDWGDGNTTTGTVTEPNGSTPGSVSNSHTYTTAGVYTITLTVTNSQGLSGQSIYQYLSVYNPTAQGLFSAGEKYTSPTGAYAQNTSLSGTVKFGLSYKYQGSVPVGNKEFSMNFNAANFQFTATSVSSLVIANGIGTLRGTGTVNGSGTYSFLVTGSESTKTIRIQITDASGNVVYDTQPGAAATATPTTSVTGKVLAH